MSAHALEGTKGTGGGARLVRNLDLIVVALALPVFIVLELPLLAWAVAGGVWVLQRGIQEALTRRAASHHNPKASVGMLGASILGRVWLVALAVLIAGVIDRDAGLPGVILAAVLFQTHFTATMIKRPAGVGR